MTWGRSRLTPTGLSTVELVMALEEEFECEIPDEEARRSPRCNRRSTTSTPTSSNSAAAGETLSKRRVVVTGLGIVSPVGIGVAQGLDSILAGRSGITRISRFGRFTFASQIAGEVKGFDVTK